MQAVSISFQVAISLKIQKKLTWKKFRKHVSRRKLTQKDFNQKKLCFIHSRGFIREKEMFLGPTYFTYFVIKTFRYRTAEA
jgi:hypothetical protein